MKKNTVMAYLLLFMGLYVSQTVAHTTTGECGYAYTGKNRSGNSYKVCHYGNLPTGFNNQVSSFFVPKGFNMRLFKDSNRRGEWIDIADGVFNCPPEYDKVVSSVLYNNWSGCSTFYSGPNQTGKSFLSCETGNLVPGYNTNIASVYVVPRHFFRFYKDFDQKGDFYDVRGRWNLKADFVNQIKSMKLQHWSDCASLYTKVNRGGKLFMICDTSSYLPTGYDDAINSIVVPKKMTVTIYKDQNYRGTSLKLTEGTWSAPPEWTNSISSIRLTIEGAMTSSD